MRDIFPPQPKSKPKKDRFPLKSLFQYGLSFLILLLIIYFGLGYASGYIDTWLKLEPINLATANSIEDKKERKAEKYLIPEAKISDEVVKQKNLNEDEVKTTDEDQTSTKPEIPPTSANPSEIDKASISLQVLNGNSLWGSAAQAKTILESAGFKVASLGNASSQNYQETKIYHQSTKKAEAELVKQVLENNYQVSLEENNQLTSQFPVLVIIGRK